MVSDVFYRCLRVFSVLCLFSFQLSASSDISRDEAVSYIRDIKTSYLIYNDLSNKLLYNNDDFIKVLDDHGVTTKDLADYTEDLACVEQDDGSCIFRNEAGRVPRIVFGLILLSKNRNMKKILESVIEEASSHIELAFKYSKIQEPQKANNLIVCTLLTDMLVDFVMCHRSYFLNGYGYLKYGADIPVDIVHDVDDLLYVFQGFRDDCISYEKNHFTGNYLGFPNFVK